MSAHRIAASYDLMNALYAEGLIPKECCDLQLITPIDGALRIQYTVNVMDEDLPKLARAFQSLAVNHDA